MDNKRIPVIAVFDVGKTNKKLFLFDEHYNLVFERSAKFLETIDEDGDNCENLESLRLSVFDSLHQVFRMKQYDIKAINFASYGASLVYVDEDGMPLTPLYNYLKEYPQDLSDMLYAKYGGDTTFSLETASPLLGSLNSALQLYRLKNEKPDIFKKIKYALHLPQYLSFLVSGTYYADMTSIGCHTAMWDFKQKKYHPWIEKEGLLEKMAPITSGKEVFEATFPGNNYKVGTGFHDSSSALIPYLINFHEPFVLISTGTWCITMNPFAESNLTKEELHQDCLCYMTYDGVPVKASRLFAGYEHEVQAKRIAAYFGVAVSKFRNIEIDWNIIASFPPIVERTGLLTFSSRDISSFSDYIVAYHTLMYDLVQAQIQSTNLVLDKDGCKRIFVDGGFSKNNLYMNLLARNYPNIEIYAASMAQATALGAALAIHSHWNTQAVPADIIALRYFRTYS